MASICDRLKALERQTLKVTTEECAVLHAYAFVGGATPANGQKCDVTVTDAGNGLYDVVFDTPHPDGPAYAVVFGNLESFNTRDARDIQVVNGTQTANGFRVMTTTGDNGTSADTLVNTSFSFIVPAKKMLITGVSLS